MVFEKEGGNCFRRNKTNKHWTGSLPLLGNNNNDNFKFNVTTTCFACSFLFFFPSSSKINIKIKSIYKRVEATIQKNNNKRYLTSRRCEISYTLPHFGLTLEAVTLSKKKHRLFNKKQNKHSGLQLLTQQTPSLSQQQQPTKHIKKTTTTTNNYNNIRDLNKINNNNDDKYDTIFFSKNDPVFLKEIHHQDLALS